MKHFLFFLILSPFSFFGQLKPEMIDSLLLYGKHNELLQLLKEQPQNGQTFYQLGIAFQDKADYYNARFNYKQAARLQNSFKHQFKVIKMNMHLQAYRQAEELLAALEQQYPIMKPYNCKERSFIAGRINGTEQLTPMLSWWNSTPIR